jgi:hypothetical protein
LCISKLILYMGWSSLCYELWHSNLGTRFNVMLVDSIMANAHLCLKVANFLSESYHKSSLKTPGSCGNVNSCSALLPLCPVAYILACTSPLGLSGLRRPRGQVCPYTLSKVVMPFRYTTSTAEQQTSRAAQVHGCVLYT